MTVQEAKERLKEPCLGIEFDMNGEIFLVTRKTAQKVDELKHLKVGEMAVFNGVRTKVVKKLYLMAEGKIISSK